MCVVSVSLRGRGQSYSTHVMVDPHSADNEETWARWWPNYLTKTVPPCPRQRKNVLRLCNRTMSTPPRCSSNLLARKALNGAPKATVNASHTSTRAPQLHHPHQERARIVDNPEIFPPELDICS